MSLRNAFKCVDAADSYVGGFGVAELVDGAAESIRQLTRFSDVASFARILRRKPHTDEHDCAADALQDGAPEVTARFAAFETKLFAMALEFPRLGVAFGPEVAASG